MLNVNDFIPLLERALAAREPRFGQRHETALRLFSGFYEGEPALAIDLYAATAVIHLYAEPPAAGQPLVDAATALLRQRLPWLQAILLKTRNSPLSEEKNGVLLYGSHTDRKIRENGVWYAVDLQLNRDAGFYLDTTNLRVWLKDRMAGKTVFNTFAYTGSLGVAAMAGGAARVVHCDLNRNFLNQAKTSYTLNGFPIDRKDFLAGDVWRVAARYRHEPQSFDCVILDPPFFAEGPGGTVDQVRHSAQLINKVRPLVRDGGYLIAVNNALFVSGQDYDRTLTELAADGYLELVERIPVPADVTGYPETVTGAPITDPAPFNHSTKIAVLKIKRKNP